MCVDENKNTVKKNRAYLSKEGLIEKAKQFGFTVVGDFQGTKTPVEGVCPKGHTRKARLERIFAGDKCRRCSFIESGKIAKDPQKVLNLHEEGLTPHQIAKKLGNITPTAIRAYLNKQGIKAHKKPLKDQSRKCYTCNTVFIPKTRKALTLDKVFCSQECLSKYISARNTKYSDEKVQKAIELKKEKRTNLEIAQITNMDVNKIKQIAKNKQFCYGNKYKKRLL